MTRALLLLVVAGAAGCGTDVYIGTLPDGATAGTGTGTDTDTCVGTGSGTGTTTDTETLTACGVLPVACPGGAGPACDCAAACGAHELEARCSPVSGGSQCSCFVDGVQVGGCTSPCDPLHGPAQYPYNACDLGAGCCAALFPPKS